MKLYNVSYSGNSYKARLLLAQLEIPCTIIEVDILKGKSRPPEFLKINPNGRTPVLDDNGLGGRGRMMRESLSECRKTWTELGDRSDDETYDRNT